MLGTPLLCLMIALSPFRGPVHSASTAFAVRINGKPSQVVHLRAVGVPAGYVASFCTARVCAPFQVQLALPKSGRESIELQLIQNVPGAAPPKTVTVAAAGARSASIAFPVHAGKTRSEASSASVKAARGAVARGAPRPQRAGR